ncbi:MAG: hypothetical protein ABI867_38170 [Kofleriaceae bacterium]
MNDAPQVQATLEPVRFGEFLRDRNKISDEQWLAALAAHWSSPSRRRRMIGATIVAQGFLPSEVVEAEARLFHDDLDIVEVVPRSEKTTIPLTY